MKVPEIVYQLEHCLASFNPPLTTSDRSAATPRTTPARALAMTALEWLSSPCQVTPCPCGLPRSAARAYGGTRGGRTAIPSERAEHEGDVGRPPFRERERAP